MASSLFFAREYDGNFSSLITVSEKAWYSLRTSSIPDQGNRVWIYRNEGASELGSHTAQRDTNLSFKQFINLFILSFTKMKIPRATTIKMGVVSQLHSHLLLQFFISCFITTLHFLIKAQLSSSRKRTTLVNVCMHEYLHFYHKHFHCHNTVMTLTPVDKIYIYFFGLKLMFVLPNYKLHVYDYSFFSQR